MNDDTQITVARTLWTDTLMELLMAAVKKGNEKEVDNVLAELKTKKYKREDIERYAKRNLDSLQIRQLMAKVATMSKRQ
ncbi:MAG: hypothetical protein AAF384_08365 [Pseudomonadota bacterium]